MFPWRVKDYRNCLMSLFHIATTDIRKLFWYTFTMNWVCMLMQNLKHSAFEASDSIATSIHAMPMVQFKDLRDMSCSQRCCSVSSISVSWSMHSVGSVTPTRQQQQPPQDCGDAGLAEDTKAASPCGGEMDPSSGGSSGNGSRSSLVFSVRGPIPIQLGTLST